MDPLLHSKSKRINDLFQQNTNKISYDFQTGIYSKLYLSISTQISNHCDMLDISFRNKELSDF